MSYSMMLAALMLLLADSGLGASISPAGNNHESAMHTIASRQASLQVAQIPVEPVTAAAAVKCVASMCPSLLHSAPSESCA
jgi:hypothetical protein